MDFLNLLLLQREDRKELKRLIKASKEGEDVGRFIKSRIDALTVRVPDTTGMVVFGYTEHETPECRKLKEVHNRLIRDGLLYERNDKLLDITNKGAYYFFRRNLVVGCLLLVGCWSVFTLIFPLIPLFI